MSLCGLHVRAVCELVVGECGVGVESSSLLVVINEFVLCLVGFSKL